MDNKTLKAQQQAGLGVVVLGLISSTLVGCLTETKNFERLSNTSSSDIDSGIGGGGTTGDLPVAPVNPNPPVVCDPFGGSGSGGAQSGLKAELYSAGGTAYHNVGDYFQYGTRVNADLYFSKLYVPTRAFDAGFPMQTGGVLKDVNNENLMEYFALSFESKISLSPQQSEGNYQFAILSDDGAIVQLKNNNGQWQTVVNNDGDHGTMMGCAANTVAMQHGVPRDIKVKYYQGPRYHIALVLLWRRVTGNSTNYYQCGTAGNSRWFDSTQNPSVATSTWYDLLGDGWQVVGDENFTLATGTNPCAS